MDCSTLTDPLIQKDSLCTICLLNYSDYSVPTCDHKFCRDCMEIYLAISINDGNVLSIICPQTNCNRILTNSIIQGLVPAALFEKYLDFHKRKTQEADIYFRWCPQRNCHGFAIFTNSNKLSCNACSNDFCFLCAEPWHYENKCKEEEKAYMQWAASKRIKNCPNCKVRTERISGCNSISCSKCGSAWCWLCNLPMENHDAIHCTVGKNVMNVNLSVLLVLIFLPVLFPFSLEVAYLFLLVQAGDMGDIGENMELMPAWFVWIFRHCIIVSIVLIVFSPILIGLGIGIGIPVLLFAIPAIKIQSTTVIHWIGTYISRFFVTFFCFCAGLVAFVVVLGIAPILGVSLLILKIFNLIFIRDN